MAIIWCGGEDIDFTFPTLYSIDTLTSYRRTSYSRCTILLFGNATQYGYSPEFTPLTSGWASCVSYVPSATNYAYRLLGFRDSVLDNWLGISFNGTNKVAIVKRTGGVDTVLATETGTSALNSTTLKWDFRLQNYGENGRATVYLNGNVVVTFEGDIRVGSTTEFDQVMILGGNSGSGYYTCFSEVIVADEDTRLMSLKTLVPDAAGDSSQWLGAYTAIDEITKAESDVIYTEEYAKVFTCNLTGMPTGDFLVKGVKFSARAVRGIANFGLQMGIKTNSVEHYGGTRELDNFWENIEEIYQLNPETSNKFTSAEIDALQIAFKSIDTTP